MHFKFLLVNKGVKVSVVNVSLIIIFSSINLSSWLDIAKNQLNKARFINPRRLRRDWQRIVVRLIIRLCKNVSSCGTILGICSDESMEPIL